MIIIKKKLSLRDASTLFYQVIGEGKPLFLLHGNSQTHHYFNRQVKHLKAYFTLFLIDTRDHGKSTNTQSDLTFEMLSADLYELMMHERLEKVSIIGFSDGGNIALSFAQQYPSFVDRMILISPNNHVNGLKEKQTKQTNRLIRLVHFLGLKKRERVLCLATRSLDLSAAELMQLKMPILIIQGEHDIIKRSHIEELVSQLPNGQLEIALNTKHSVPFLKASWFNQYALTFLNKKEAS